MKIPIVLISCTLGLAACSQDQSAPNPLATDTPDAPDTFVLETPSSSTRTLPPGTSEQRSAPDTSAVIAFADPGLEAAVREALEQPTDPLRQNALLVLEELIASSRGIVDLSGIEHLHNLAFLNLAKNRIADIAPLAELTQLQYLVLDHNQIADLTPLSDLELLEILLLDANKIEDLGPLLPLAENGRLERIDLAENPLSTLSLDIQVAALRAAGIDLYAEEGLLPESPEPTETTFTSDINPSNLKILFQSNRRAPESNNGLDLFVMNTGGGRVIDIFADYEESFNPSAADWSPDGERLAFSEGGELYTICFDGTDLQEISDVPGRVSRPSYSPDGSQLAFFFSDNGDRFLALVPTSDGPYAEVINLSEELGGSIRYNNNLPWAPDGFTLGLNLRIDGEGELFAADLLSGILLNLSQTPDHSEFGMRWSPDGQNVLFASDFTGDSEIYLARLDGAPPENISNHSASDWSPQFSPDGRRVLFLSDRDGGADLFVMNINGTEPLRIADNPQTASGALWSPDGSLIAFSMQVGDASDVFIMNADGTDPINITNSIGDDWTVSWSPR